MSPRYRLSYQLHHGSFASNSGFAVEITRGKISISRYDQPKALDLDAIYAKFLETINSEILDDVIYSNL